MNHRSVVLCLLPACLLAALLTSCSRDPNVRKQKYFASGQQYFAQGKYREAAIQFSNAVEIDPGFTAAHYQLSQTFLELHDTNRAFVELNLAVEQAPDNYPARTQLANLLIAARNPDGSPVPDALRQAKTQLDALREKLPDSADTHQAWSSYYAAQNNLVPALQEIEQAITLDPNRADSYIMRALLQLRSGHTGDAETSFLQAVKVDSKSVNAVMALGGFYQSRGLFQQAELQFRNAIQLDPKNPGPRAALVRVLMQQGKKQEAEAFLAQSKKDFPDNSEGYRMLGDFYFASGDLDRATTEYESLYREHPGDPRVKKNFIQLLILKNRLDQAAALNNEILKSNPRDVDALVYKGELQLRHNDDAAAVESLESALRSDADNAVAHYQLGLAYEAQHDDTRAESEWREAVRLNPALADAHRALAALELRRGDTNALLVTAERIIDSQPAAADGFLLRCVAESALARYSEALKDAQQAALLAPASPAPFVQMGNLALLQKHFPDAEKFYRQALGNDPSSAEGLSGLMNTDFAEKRYDDAIAAAQAQIAKSPNSSNFYDLLGTALTHDQKDLPGAETALRKAVDLDSNNTDALEKLGKVQIEEGNADQALALYQQEIKSNPRQARFYILCGEIFESRQNWDQAKAMYRQALSIAPDQALASNNLAYLMLQTGGNVDVALAMAQSARRGSPEWPNAADTLGWAYYQKGIYQTAISQFKEALRLSEKGGLADDAVVHYHLGLAYQKANRNSLARQQLERALRLSPDYADAKKALSELHG